MADRTARETAAHEKAEKQCQAIADFKKTMQTETMVEKELEELLKTIDNEQ